MGISSEVQCFYSGPLPRNNFPALQQSPGIVSPMQLLWEAGLSQLIGPGQRGSLSSWNRLIHLIVLWAPFPQTAELAWLLRPLRCNLSASAVCVYTDSIDGANQLLSG